MLIITILKIEKLIIINRKINQKLYSRNLSLMAELMVIEPYMRILSVKDTISVVQRGSQIYEY